MTLENLPKGLRSVESNINQELAKNGRDGQNLCLVAVSKGHSFDKIKSLYDLGFRDFGESYVSELKLKLQNAEEQKISDIKWHFIGQIQSNKLKIISKCDYVHSLCSLRHVQMLSKIATKNIQCFLQVYLGKDSNRQGIRPINLIKDLPNYLNLKNIKIIGLMTILPINEENSLDAYFLEMLNLKKEVENSGYLKTPMLSMGMTSDYPTAIKYGANFIRVGTAIFGQRNNQE